MKKRILALVLVLSLFAMSANGVAYALGTDAVYVDNNLSAAEVNELVEEIEDEVLETDNSVEDTYSAEELEEYIEDSEGVECVEAEDTEISINDAVEELFNNATLNELDMEDRHLAMDEGMYYITETYQDEGVTYVKTYSDDKSKMSLSWIEEGQICSETYLYDPELQCYEKQTVAFICNELADEKVAHAQGISYGKKTNSATWDDTKFWYQTGNNGKKTYLKIGCKATYRIRTDNISSARDKKCENYMKAVKSSKSYETKAIAYLSGTGISIFAIEVAILANAAFPPSTIVTIVCGLFNGVAIYKAVDNMVDSYEKWQDARDYYNVIKTYGTKL
ncbi:MAG: hypothetical protein IKJ77_05905 [Firmicutes bacterium]|nr:hypothetical protein [Bacillota bacterium]